MEPGDVQIDPAVFVGEGRSYPRRVRKVKKMSILGIGLAAEQPSRLLPLQLNWVSDPLGQAELSVDACAERNVVRRSGGEVAETN